MPQQISRCLDDPKELWHRQVCLDEVSKNARGDLCLIHRERQECEPEKCLTLKTRHMLRLELRSHDPCDSDLGQLLDGQFFALNLVTAFADGSGEQRGTHTADFEWVTPDVTVHGSMSGITNAGTHREPPFDPCQECYAPGFMEGRLCGRIVKSRKEELVGCAVTAVYRFRFDPSEGAIDTGVEGTVEGVVVCPCRVEQNCIDFTAFPAMAHPNPWVVGGTTFQVLDFQGNPTATADVVTWGAFTGLNVNYETRVALPSPASGVEATLVHFVQPATVTALDGNGTVVDTATMTNTQAVAQTLTLSGANIERLLITAPQDETLLLELCYRS